MSNANNEKQISPHRPQWHRKLKREGGEGAHAQGAQRSASLGASHIYSVRQNSYTCETRRICIHLGTASADSRLTTPFTVQLQMSIWQCLHAHDGSLPSVNAAGDCERQRAADPCLLTTRAHGPVQPRAVLPEAAAETPPEAAAETPPEAAAETPPEAAAERARERRLILMRILLRRHPHHQRAKGAPRPISPDLARSRPKTNPAPSPSHHPTTKTLQRRWAAVHTHTPGGCEHTWGGALTHRGGGGEHSYY
eukprot:CAMPEP_0181213206 /NCGR_PEP_ID=MMETSP1096-20121128/24775_1 /TAXON_ID=156174 ORGANISM="Chrysochromulina ericina, Strain CCMP281" /NCGR_SAMPLE_ID=MMETSP1096 /ASSEMBLY_ACC=CAM_ASM_000453 /LENGTH=251 /DNA_ID=CAMNT_0023304817 /DNA_START=128 /DNA_END=885 /DNA_ORIENTATION=+